MNDVINVFVDSKLNQCWAQKSMAKAISNVRIVFVSISLSLSFFFLKFFIEQVCTTDGLGKDVFKEQRLSM